MSDGVWAAADCDEYATEEETFALEVIEVAWDPEDGVSMFRIHGGTKKVSRCSRIRLVSLAWSTDGEEFTFSDVTHVRPTDIVPSEYRARAESLLREVTLAIAAVETSGNNSAGRSAFAKRFLVLGSRGVSSTPLPQSSGSASVPYNTLTRPLVPCVLSALGSLVADEDPGTGSAILEAG